MELLAKLTLSAGALALGAFGCAEQTDPGASGTPGTGLSVQVAPLVLPSMTDACYGLTVYNTTDLASFGPTTEVWTQPNLCASQYGADGGIRFTGICDAEAGDNAIRLVLNNVYTGGTFDGGGTALADGTDFVNPCPAPASPTDDNGCILTAPCTQNQDSKIIFNLTVMRNASLGFFDTLVKFQDLFCAAKLDCVEDDGVTTMTYLPDPNTDADGATAVLAFACTGGPGAKDTYLYLDQVVVTCRDASGAVTRTATVDPSARAGNVTPTQTGTPDVLFGAAVTRGDGFNGAAFWNVLLGMNLNGGTAEICAVTSKGYASETALPMGATPDHTRYPVVRWNVELSAGVDRTCSRHPLNHSDGDVETVYTAIDVPEQISFQLQRGTGGEVINVGVNISDLYKPYLEFFDKQTYAIKQTQERVDVLAEQIASWGATAKLEDIARARDLLKEYSEQTLVARTEVEATNKVLKVSYEGWVVQYAASAELLKSYQSDADRTIDALMRISSELESKIIFLIRKLDELANGQAA